MIYHDDDDKSSVLGWLLLVLLYLLDLLDLLLHHGHLEGDEGHGDGPDQAPSIRHPGSWLLAPGSWRYSAVSVNQAD